jgi:hypothetical protein
MKYFVKSLVLCILLLANGCNNSIELESKDLQVIITEPKRVSYCEIATNPEKYSGQTLILNAVYMLQFEASHFVTYECQPKISFIANFNAPPCSEKSEIEPWDFSSGMLDRVHGVIVKGWYENKIYEGHSIGELPKYYKFNVDCIDKIKQLGTLVVFPKDEAKIVEERVKNFEK